MNKNQQNRKPSWKKNQLQKKEVYLCPLEVEVIDGNIEKALRDLKNKLSKDGILTELKKRRNAEKPSEVKRRKEREALKKIRKSRGKKSRQKNQKQKEK